MDRRENLKVLLSGTVATGFLLSTGCGPEETKVSEQIIKGYGRTPEELIHDQKMVTILSDIIIPKDEKSGSATDAGVPDFIEFMMKDYPKFQVTMRGGLMWLDNLSRKTFDKSFTEISPEQRIQLVDLIAYPDTAAPEMQYGVKFFNLMRNLTCTGFFTTKIGFDDLGYVGNRPNQWDGVPQDVLDKFNLSYDQKTLDVCLKIEDQQKIAQWDDEGNLI
jgi:gluconate 2-dehydrogenase gamma chain